MSLYRRGFLVSQLLIWLGRSLGTDGDSSKAIFIFLNFCCKAHAQTHCWVVASEFVTLYSVQYTCLCMLVDKLYFPERSKPNQQNYICLIKNSFRDIAIECNELTYTQLYRLPVQTTLRIQRNVCDGGLL